MKAPWAGKTGTARLVAIFATTLGIATGLCGINFFAVMRFVPLSGPGPQGAPTAHDRFISALGSVLAVAGILELLTIAVSVVALIVLGILAAIRSWRDGSR